MKKLPSFCKSGKCKLYVSITPVSTTEQSIPEQGVCQAGYVNPANSVQAGINQLKHGGEFPCSKNPHRAEIAKEWGPKRTTPSPFVLQHVHSIHVRKDREVEE